jgi:hypothetical protein
MFQIDISFFNSSLPVSQNFDTSTSAPIENGHDSLTQPTPTMSKELGESEPTLFHENNNENCEDGDNEELIKMPHNDESHNEELIKMPHNDESLEENKLEVENKIWKGKVFVRKNHKEGNESISQHCHESEPGNDQSPKKRKGKSISISESRILYPDIDDPIAVRKPVRSCSKHPVQFYIILKFV